MAIQRNSKNEFRGPGQSLFSARPWRWAIIVLLATVAPALGEQGSLFTYTNENAVHLRWNAPLESGYEGFYVERKTAGGAWQRVTAEPVKRIAEVAEIRELLGLQADSFLTFFDPNLQTISDSAFDEVVGDGLARSMIQFFSVKLPEMGRVLGEIYADRNLEPGKQFHYRVILLARGGGESPWAQTSKPVEHSKVDSVPVPQGIDGKGEDSMALLTWTHDSVLSKSGRLVGYRAWRGEKPFGPFAPASYEMIIPTEVDGTLPEYLLGDRYLTNGKSYWYYVTGVNVLGFESQPSEVIEIKPKDMEPPRAPDSLVGRVLGEHGLLEWRPVEADDLAGYRVYRGVDAQGPFERLWPSEEESLRPSISYLDTAVGEGDIYWYYVTAEDQSGNESLESDKVQIFRPDVTPPAAVTDLVAVAEDDGIHIKWAENSESDVAGYMVQRTTRISGRGEAVEVADRFFVQHAGTIPLTNFLDAVPTTSQSRYAYRVLAVDNAANKSEPSQVVIARMKDETPPTQPALVAVTLEEDEMLLRWQASTEEDLAGYRVYRGSEGQEDFVSLNEALVSYDLTEYRDQPSETDKLYAYRITAVDDSGNESRPSVDLAVRFIDTVPPDPPTELQLVAEEVGYRLRWQSGDELDTDRLLLYRKEGSAKSRLWVELSGDEIEFLDDIAKEEVEYQYYLHAIDKVNNRSEPSQIAIGVYAKPEPEPEPDAEQVPEPEPNAEQVPEPDAEQQPGLAARPKE